ncbi:MAG: amidohydrolase [Coprothermobacterota bacterium]|nr:amidohydrolase [Coprothermobacterota bacterium]
MDCTLRNASIQEGRATRTADLAIRGGKIQEIGDHLGPCGQDLDLKRALLLPAFTDSHLHLHGIAAGFITVDLRDAASLEEALTEVARFASGILAGEWVTGGRWDRNRWPDSSLPDRHSLDSVLPYHAVQLWSRDGHTLWLNTLALKRLGITAQTPDLPGGQILHEEDGSPSGILLEKAADAYAPKFSALVSPERLAEAVHKAAQALNQVGIVACNHFAGEEDYYAVAGLAQQLHLPLRLAVWLDQATLPRLIEQNLHSGEGDEQVKFGGLKVFADGALGSRTAWMLDPYTSSSQRGICAVDREVLAADIGRAAQAGIATAVHAIGDAAVRLALDCFAPTASENARLRSRIEHAQLVDSSDLPRFRACGLMASVQPIHAPHDRAMALQHWGEDRTHRAYPYHSLDQLGVPLAFGSDAPVEDPNPLPGLFAAVFRRLFSDPPEHTIGLEESLSLERALSAFTTGGAWGMYAEGVRGRLAPGLLADLVVLDHNIFQDPLALLPQTHILATFLEGEPVYLADNSFGQ